VDFVVSLDSTLRAISESETGKASLAQRIRSEIEFARDFRELFPDKKAKWEPLILKAAELVSSKISANGPVDLAAIVAEAEGILAPIGKAAKEYTIHCCGHAHIDMNWLWPWQETINISHDTFMTVDKLMDEFPEFHFGQSQASTYIGMEEFCPEIFGMIKKRLKEGRWESTASMWVEGDKNMASGEILCRHILYTKRYFKEKFDMEYDSIKIDWEGDTFGHCHTLPTILNHGGVTRYYHCRTGPADWLMWWQAPDGSKVLRFHDKCGYNGRLSPAMVFSMIDYVKENGMKDWMFVYGVGDHGGGPTRQDLRAALDMQTWPIFPSIKLSTTEAYLSIVEKANPNLPVFNQELNFEFDGCYTSQSNIKRANRVGENILPEIEAISLVAGATVGFPYPAEDIFKGWRMVMFNQFHDILPGSGIHATYEYSQGLFQETQAIAGAIRTRALRKLASSVNTSKASGIKPPTGVPGVGHGDGLGAGGGDINITGGVTSRNAGASDAEPILVYNQLAFPRSDVVLTRIWNKDLPTDRITVRDETGKTVGVQFEAKGHYWGHDFQTILFPVKDVPATGYKVYTIDRAAEPVPTEGVKLENGVMENEFVRVEMDAPSGAIKHLIDKATGYDYVPEGELMGVLEYCEEVPNGMSAWTIGQIKRLNKLDQDGTFSEVLHGPHRCSVKTDRKVGDSRVTLHVGLNAGSPMVDFAVDTRWVEIGTNETCIPMLRIAFPTKVSDPTATQEIAFGKIERPVDGREVPALKWADVSGGKVDAKGKCGVTMVNADKYGHNFKDNVMRLTLLRSSHSPDPLPEVTDHSIRLAIIPHDGPLSISEATKAGASFGLPMNLVSTDVHEGKLPASKGFVEVLTPNVMLASVKKAEDSDAVIVRLYEMEGKATEAKVKIADIIKAKATAVQTDVMEQPLKKSTAKWEKDTLTVKIPAHGLVSVKIE
jgi:alpha-mannosidase